MAQGSTKEERGMNWFPLFVTLACVTGVATIFTAIWYSITLDENLSNTRSQGRWIIVLFIVTTVAATLAAGLYHG